MCQPSDEVMTLLAAGVCRGEPGSPAIPYARLEAQGMAGARSGVVSSFTIIKGSMIDETYAPMSHHG